MKIKKNISVVLNGQIPSDKSLIQRISSSDYIIAVDGSANQLNKLNILPNVVIGDFDSIESFNDSNVELIEANDQSKTDFRKTLEWCIKKNISHKKVVSFDVKYKNLSLVEIENYLNYEKPFNCVGCIKSEGLGISLLEEINSSDPTAIIGLPLIALVSILNKFGVIINGKA